MNQPKEIDIHRILNFNIPNLREIRKDGAVIGVRGESLSGAKNLKFLKGMKEAGIRNIIDLRSSDHTDKFVHACEAANLKCFHFPVDRSHTSDREIIENLPLLTKIIDNGGFYIACAQGMHRTDIALSLYYLFNREDQDPPILYGHIKNGNFRCDDIFERANNIYRGLTAEDKLALGLDDEFARIFISRKKQLIANNKQHE